MSDLDYILTETPMLQHSQDTVFLSHSLFLEALKNSSSYISKLRRQEIARNLLDKIELLGLDNYHYNVIRINIFCELDSHDEVSKLSASFARELYTLGQFNHSFSYYMLADKHYSKCFDGEDSISEFSCELALGKTECKIKTENFSKDELESDIKECRRLISKVSDNKGKSLTDYAVRVMLLENYFYHYYGEFLQALSITERLLEIAEASDAGRDTEFLGAIWAEYAIAVKETSSLENALQIFRKASKLCPDSHNLRFARLTHLSEKYSSIKPKLAQRYIEMVFPLEPYMDLPEIYHNRVNYAASLFNCHEYERALREAKRIFKDTYTIGLKNEEGRIVNLLGCYHLKKMEYETAYEYFRHGIKIFRSENYIANLWPLLTNTATVHMRLGSYPEALEMVRRCVNIYVDCYGLRISKIMSAENYYEKLYAGVLLVTFYLKRLTKEEYDDAKPLLNKLYKPITSPRILSVLEGLDSEKALARALEHSVYVHDGIVCIKS